MSTYTFAFPKTQRRIALILEALARRPMTRDEVQCLLGIRKDATRAYLRYLSDEPKRIYIARWVSTRGPHAPVYAVGNQPDVPKPKPLTNQERAKMEWAHIRADQERYDRAKSAARVRVAIHRMRGKPQPWFAALPGARSLVGTKEAA